jgi:DNA-binding GntR family transcriptional regulator
MPLGSDYADQSCALGLPSYKAQSDREHAALLDSVRRGDVAHAQSLVTKHLLGTGGLLHRFLCQDAEAAAAAPREIHAR